MMRGVWMWWPVLPVVVVLFLANPGQAAAAQGTETEAGASWVHLLEQLFVPFTAGVIAFGILIIELEVLHWAWSKVRRRGHSAGLASMAAPVADDRLPFTKVRRFDRHQRVQHFILLASFLVLAVTGISQKFYTSTPFDDFIWAIGGMDALRLIHRVAGVVLIVNGIYHMLYIIPGLIAVQGGIPTLRQGRWLEMIPNLKDFQDFLHMMGYYLGVYPQPPQFGHYNYMQKFDYWAVYWGVVIMAVSGVILLIPALGIELTGTTIIAAALAAHSDEAVMAVVWILIVHLYHAHLTSRVFPFNPTIFTGNISVKHIREAHSLEYAHLIMEQEEPSLGAREEPANASAADQQPAASTET